MIEKTVKLQFNAPCNWYDIVDMDENQIGEFKVYQCPSVGNYFEGICKDKKCLYKVQITLMGYEEWPHGTKENNNGTHTKQTEKG